jgi:hypothetical protein
MAALRPSFVPLTQSAIALAAKGVTSLAEVIATVSGIDEFTDSDDSELDAVATDRMLAS